MHASASDLFQAISDIPLRPTVLHTIPDIFHRLRVHGFTGLLMTHSILPQPLLPQIFPRCRGISISTSPSNQDTQIGTNLKTHKNKPFPLMRLLLPLLRSSLHGVKDKNCTDLHDALSYCGAQGLLVRDSKIASYSVLEDFITFPLASNSRTFTLQNNANSVNPAAGIIPFQNSQGVEVALWNSEHSWMCPWGDINCRRLDLRPTENSFHH